VVPPTRAWSPPGGSRGGAPSPVESFAVITTVILSHVAILKTWRKLVVVCDGGEAAAPAARCKGLAMLVLLKQVRSARQAMLVALSLGSPD